MNHHMYLNLYIRLIKVIFVPREVIPHKYHKYNISVIITHGGFTIDQGYEMHLICPSLEILRTKKTTLMLPSNPFLLHYQQ